MATRGLTMSIPAARYTDMVLCGTHHLPGAVSYPFQLDVKIHGLRAARFSDQCTCPEGDKSLIVEGAAEVLIEGLPAARLLGRSTDGGTIVTGDFSVLIGGATFAVPACIKIAGDLDFQQKVMRDLAMNGTTKSGKLLFKAMEESGHACTIRPVDKEHPRSGTRTDPEVPERLLKDQDPNDLFHLPQTTSNDVRCTVPGQGTDATVYYNPKDGDSTLFHEGVHANDMMHGTFDEGLCANPGGEDPCHCCERRAVGLSPYDDPQKYPFSQNSYNAERDYPLCTRYPREGDPCTHPSTR
jgi:uncharacterized Zn-binding protein involved in type VI secretion